ncbi:hypothetical protein NLJ89_g1734 [Agrocybe chaxingu]|uniref:PPM-type phosphatase domain-containing protein n=1 Tax=Agrocybe chaxingu TaxID=84603 RepID=A0A9W8MZH4_9AGAR|nr:hypothetical protein NLJ89_g1734 [Agrocybe chaxingu]
MLYRAFRYGTYLPSRYPVPPFLGSNGLGLISKRTFITTSTRKTLTLKDTHPDLVILGIGIGLAGVSILQSKKQKSSDVKFSSAVRHLLPNNFQDEEIKWLLQVLQHVPFDNFDTALANLAAIGSSEPSNLKTLLRVEGISLQSTSPSYLSAASMEIALPGYHFHGQGIFEGQKGPAMSEMLFTKLFPVLASAMHVYLNEQDGNSLSPEEIMTFIKKTFVAIDHIHVLFKLRDIFEAVKDHATSRAEDGDEVIYTVPLKTFSKKDAKALADACSASTALVALYNDFDCSLYVARTGSGRAILGRRVKDPGGGTRYKYETRILLAEDDPDDGHSMIGFLQERYTAEPTIVRFPDVQRGDFVVLGSQGLWECLDNEQVVGLVGHWLEEQGIKEIVGDSPDTQREVIVPWTNRTLSQFAAASPFLKESTFSPEDLPVIYPEGYQDRARKYKSWKAEKRFISVARDLNVASHVARNALGGADRELAEALYQIGGDVGKQLRDDIYVCVLFFG